MILKQAKKEADSLCWALFLSLLTVKSDLDGYAHALNWFLRDFLVLLI